MNYKNGRLLKVILTIIAVGAAFGIETKNELTKVMADETKLSNVNEPEMISKNNRIPEPDFKDDIPESAFGWNEIDILKNLAGVSPCVEWADFDYDEIIAEIDNILKEYGFEGKDIDKKRMIALKNIVYVMLWLSTEKGLQTLNKNVRTCMCKKIIDRLRKTKVVKGNKQGNKQGNKTIVKDGFTNRVCFDKYFKFIGDKQYGTDKNSEIALFYEKLTPEMLIFSDAFYGENDFSSFNDEFVFELIKYLVENGYYNYSVNTTFESDVPKNRNTRKSLIDKFQHRFSYEERGILTEKGPFELFDKINSNILDRFGIRELSYYDEKGQTKTIDRLTVKSLFESVVLSNQKVWEQFFELVDNKDSVYANNHSVHFDMYKQWIISLIKSEKFAGDYTTKLFKTIINFSQNKSRKDLGKSETLQRLKEKFVKFLENDKPTKDFEDLVKDYVKTSNMLYWFPNITDLANSKENVSFLNFLKSLERATDSIIKWLSNVVDEDVKFLHGQNLSEDAEENKYWNKKNKEEKFVAPKMNGVFAFDFENYAELTRKAKASPIYKWANFDIRFIYDEMVREIEKAGFEDSKEIRQKAFSNILKCLWWFYYKQDVKFLNEDGQKEVTRHILDKLKSSKKDDKPLLVCDFEVNDPTIFGVNSDHPFNKTFVENVVRTIQTTGKKDMFSHEYKRSYDDIQTDFEDHVINERNMRYMLVEKFEVKFSSKYIKILKEAGINRVFGSVNKDILKLTGIDYLRYIDNNGEEKILSNSKTLALLAQVVTANDAIWGEYLDLLNRREQGENVDKEAAEYADWVRSELGNEQRLNEYLDNLFDEIKKRDFSDKNKLSMWRIIKTCFDEFIDKEGNLSLKPRTLIKDYIRVSNMMAAIPFDKISKLIFEEDKAKDKDIQSRLIYFVKALKAINIWLTTGKKSKDSNEDFPYLERLKRESSEANFAKDKIVKQGIRRSKSMKVGTNPIKSKKAESKLVAKTDKYKLESYLAKEDDKEALKQYKFVEHIRNRSQLNNLKNKAMEVDMEKWIEKAEETIEFVYNYITENNNIYVPNGSISYENVKKITEESIIEVLSKLQLDDIPLLLAGKLSDEEVEFLKNAGVFGRICMSIVENLRSSDDCLKDVIKREKDREKGFFRRLQENGAKGIEKLVKMERKLSPEKQQKLKDNYIKKLVTDVLAEEKALRGKIDMDVNGKIKAMQTGSEQLQLENYLKNHPEIAVNYINRHKNDKDNSNKVSGINIVATFKHLNDEKNLDKYTNAFIKNIVQNINKLNKNKDKFLVEFIDSYNGKLQKSSEKEYNRNKFFRMVMEYVKYLNIRAIYPEPEKLSNNKELKKLMNVVPFDNNTEIPLRFDFKSIVEDLNEIFKYV